MLKNDFLLDPEVAYLNHGSFGACPRPVFDAYQRYQRELEREPVDFLQRRYRDLMEAARTSLASYLGCSADDLAFVRNATYGMNVVARSLRLGRGDTILITDQEYGAVDRMWQTIAEDADATLVRVPIPVQAASAEVVLEAFRQRLDSSVRVIALSHIVSELALLLPVGELVQLAHQSGVPIAIDGAHAPGQVPLELSSLGADFYVGNCHKWLLSPKGAAFLYATPHWADRIRPPVISWGTISHGTSALQLENEWSGTSDISAILAVRDAVDFLDQHRWLENVAPQCAQLLEEMLPRLLDATGQTREQLPGPRPPQMASIKLPPGEHSSLHDDLYRRHQVEVPVFSNKNGSFLRVSAQAYNTRDDLERLATALETLL